MDHVDLPHGRLQYHRSGAGRPIVLLHGYLMGAGLWAPTVERLDREFLCLVPELPFGAHRIALKPDADLTAIGLGRLVADFLEALDLHDAVLVGNDSGGAVAQVVAARHPERLAGLVLTSCDAFDNFPPKLFRPLIGAARANALSAVLAPLRARSTRSLPNAYGWLTHGEPPHELIDEWIAAYFADKDVRRDLRRLTVALGDNVLPRIATELAGFTRPALLAWAQDDKFFPPEHARRLAGILPNARVELVPRSRTWVMLDQPDLTARLIADFARNTASQPA